MKAQAYSMWTHLAPIFAGLLQHSFRQDLVTSIASLINYTTQNRRAGCDVAGIRDCDGPQHPLSWNVWVASARKQANIWFRGKRSSKTTQFNAEKALNRPAPIGLPEACDSGGKPAIPQVHSRSTPSGNSQNQDNPCSKQNWEGNHSRTGQFFVAVCCVD